MKAKIRRCILCLLAVICVFCTSVSVIYAEPQGTNGDELQIMEAEKLEIQLGAGWSGVEFQLRTDYGIYPGTIPVGEDGVLRLEIGGSSSYILSCVASETAAPTTAQPPATPSGPQSGTAEGKPASDKDQTKPSDSAGTETEPNKDKTASGIPVLHIVLFVGGMVVACGSLIIMNIVKRRREEDSDYMYDDDEDD